MARIKNPDSYPRIFFNIAEGKYDATILNTSLFGGFENAKHFCYKWAEFRRSLRLHKHPLYVKAERIRLRVEAETACRVRRLPNSTQRTRNDIFEAKGASRAELQEKLVEQGFV